VFWSFCGKVLLFKLDSRINWQSAVTRKLKGRKMIFCLFQYSFNDLTVRLWRNISNDYFILKALFFFARPKKKQKKAPQTKIQHALFAQADAIWSVRVEFHATFVDS
jgi:hypothetical protein